MIRLSEGFMTLLTLSWPYIESPNHSRIDACAFARGLVMGAAVIPQLCAEDVDDMMFLAEHLLERGPWAE